MADQDELKTKLQLPVLMKASNIVPLLDKDDVTTIGNLCADAYAADQQSRTEWSERQANANKLAQQVMEERTFPWPNASNVKFPLVTVAALQYHARAYPALISSNEVVKCRVVGRDLDGSRTRRADRLSTHMSWQNLEQDVQWEEEHDKLLLVQPISGTAFIKRFFDPVMKRQQTKLILPANLVIHYFATTLEEAERYTHVYYLSHNAIKQRELAGYFSEVETEPSLDSDQSRLQTVAKDDRQGIRAPPDDRSTPYFTAEQYCKFDLDGDGYREPYVVTFDINTNRVRRIVARYTSKGIRVLDGPSWNPGDTVYSIQPIKIFQKFGFIPSPDGGFYDLGLGSLLGPINAAVDTAINEMLDAGHMSTLGGGFLGRGFKGKGGPITFQPNQWYPVDAPGDDLRKSIFPRPNGQVPDYLMALLQLLIQYSERIVSATDLQVGENVGQNTPAETARTMNQNGSRVFNGIYKRTYRALKGEYNIQYDLNRVYLEVDEDYTELTTGQGAMISPSDYQDENINVRPAADPHSSSETEQIEQAKMLVQNSVALPGHNKYQALLRLYKAMKVPNIDEVMPAPTAPNPQTGQVGPAKDFPPVPNPKMLDIQLKEKQFQFEQMQWKEERQDAVRLLQADIAKISADIIKSYAQAEKLLAEAKGVETGHQIALINAEIGAKKNHMDGLLKGLEILQKSMEKKESGDNSGPAGVNAGAGMAGMGAGAEDQGVLPPAKPNGAGGAGGLAAPTL